MKKTFADQGEILIFSEARSGSTWLMEILSQLPKTVTNWEPLHQNFGTIPKKLNWGWRPFIPFSDRNPLFVKIIEDSLSLSTFTPWTVQFNSLTQLREGEIVITKFVRANMLLPWFLKRISLKRKPILLLRHPIDTCLSQVNTFDKGKDINIPNWINNERFITHHSFLNTLETKLEIRLANWCINNVSVVQNKEVLRDVIPVFYEDLLRDPKKELNRILKELEIDTDAKNLLKNIKKGSYTDFQKTYLEDSEQQLEKRILQLDEQTKERIQRIFDHFGLTIYNAYSPISSKKNINLA
ncbi:sulfotransferase domain-containing protein [Sediminitomix flava]|nr:sulfotransferase domain-containing protein [Sediminitomix flava]